MADLKFSGFVAEAVDTTNTRFVGYVDTTTKNTQYTLTQIESALFSTTPLPVPQGGTGVGTLGDGYVLLGSGTSAITALDVTAKGSILVGDGTTDPVALAVGGSDGDVLTIDAAEASGLKWATAGGGGGGSGICGISDAAGAYTYYATMTLALAAASSGDTIEVFADIVESGAVTLTMVDGVIIQGNGHTYTLDTADGTNAITLANATVLVQIYNWIVKRENAVAGTFTGYTVYTYLGSGAANKRFIGTGSKFYNDSNDVFRAYSVGTNPIHFYDCWASCTHASYSAFHCGGREHYNCEAYGVGLGFWLGSCYNCIATSTGSYCFYYNGDLYNCVGISTANSAVYLHSSYVPKVRNCVFKSTANFAGFAYSTGGQNIYNSSFISTTNNALSGISQTYKLNNCTIKGTTPSRPTVARNCTLITTAGAGAQMGKYYNCTIETEWNDPLGSAVECVYLSAGTANHLINCTTIQVDATVEAIRNTNGASAEDFYATGSSFFNCNSILGTNLTNLAANTADSQGNIIV